MIDFTTPLAVMGNIEACVNAGKNMVVGTTGWYGDLEKVRQMVDKKRTGFLYGANFSIGINLLFEAAQTAAGILQHQYSGQISSVIMRKRKMRLRERLQLCKRLSAIRPAKNWKSHRSAKATWSACTRSCSIRRTTQFISAMIQSRAGDLPRERCGRRSGWPERKVFSILRIFGERRNEPSFARLTARPAVPRGSCHIPGTSEVSHFP